MALVNPRAAGLGRSNVILRGRGSRNYHVREFPEPLSIQFMAAGRGVWQTPDGGFVEHIDHTPAARASTRAELHERLSPGRDCPRQSPREFRPQQARPAAGR